jgi:hypothetical protein
MNLIQELPSKYKEGAEQQIQMPCVETMTAAAQYGAVLPPLNIE